MAERFREKWDRERFTPEGYRAKILGEIASARAELRESEAITTIESHNRGIDEYNENTKRAKVEGTDIFESLMLRSQAVRLSAEGLNGTLEGWVSEAAKSMKIKGASDRLSDARSRYEAFNREYPITIREKIVRSFRRVLDYNRSK